MTINNNELHSISVLIVDCDVKARKETQTMLARFGIGSDSYGDFTKAMDMIRLHHARRQDYDLILVDYALMKKTVQSLFTKFARYWEKTTLSLL